MKYPFIILSLFLSIPLFSQTTLTLQPGPTDGIDAKIDELIDFDNFGDDPELIGATRTNDAGQTGSLRSLFYFDLALLPANAEITTAELSLYYNYISLSPGQIGSNASFLRRIRQSWEEHDVSWSSQPNYWSTNEVLLPESTSSNQDYEKINVTALVRDMINDPAHSYGFILMEENEQPLSSMKFFSSDGSIPLKRPKLEITYHLPSPTNEIRFLPLSVTPNPFENTLWIKGLQGNINITVLDLNGKTIFSKQLSDVKNSFQLDQLNGLSPGMYYIKATGDSDQYFARIIKAN